MTFNEFVNEGKLEIANATALEKFLIDTFGAKKVGQGDMRKAKGESFKFGSETHLDDSFGPGGVRWYIFDINGSYFVASRDLMSRPNVRLIAFGKKLEDKYHSDTIKELPTIHTKHAGFKEFEKFVNDNK